MNVAESFELNTSALNAAQCFIAGVECEIESVRSQHDFPHFHATQDGSLRNNGIEFISVPLPKVELLTSFNNLHASIEFYERDIAFSPRTSTHVHINCRSLSTEQVKTLVLLYALYEEFFFAMTSPDRRTNIHCVPLTETYLPVHYHRSINHLVQRWHKYTALNILPLAKLGTVEFRHLQGTGDINLFSEWVNTLETLWKMCQRYVITDDFLLDPKRLKDLWKELFQQSPRVLALDPAFEQVIGNSLLDVKLAFNKNATKKD